MICSIIQALKNIFMICSIIQALKKSSAKNKWERKEMTNYLWFVLLFKHLKIFLWFVLLFKHLKKVQPKISVKEKKWQIIYDFFSAET